jgi:cyclic beta-1,2-glucan synthetase
LGVRVRGDVIEIDPCIPDHWPGFEVSLRHGGCRYEISVTNPHAVNNGVMHAEADGIVLPQGPIRVACRPGARSCSIKIILGPPQKR